MQLYCKNCGEPIQVRNINMGAMTAACEGCNAVFEFSASDVGGTKSKRLKIERPDAFTVAEGTDEDTFTIEMNWRKMFGSMEWFFIILMLVGGIILSAVSLLLLFGGDNGGGVAQVLSGLNMGNLMKVLLGLGFLGGAALCWYCIAIFAVEKTRLTLDDERLRLVHYPLYWKGKDIPRGRIVSVEITPFEGFENYHSLNVVTDEGKRHTLDNYQTEHARYLQTRLQRALFPPAANVVPRADYRDAILTDDGELAFTDEDVAGHQQGAIGRAGTAP